MKFHKSPLAVGRPVEDLDRVQRRHLDLRRLLGQVNAKAEDNVVVSHTSVPYDRPI